MRTFQHVPVDQRLDLLKVMANATPLMQAVMVLMIAAALACVVIWARQALAARRGGAATGASAAFLNGVLVAAPLFALASAAFEMLHMSLGIANLRPVPDVIDLAPGFAEMSLLVFLGFVASGAAAAARAHMHLRAAQLP